MLWGLILFFPATALLGFAVWQLGLTRPRKRKRSLHPRVHRALFLVSTTFFLPTLKLRVYSAQRCARAPQKRRSGMLDRMTTWFKNWFRTKTDDLYAKIGGGD